MRTPARPAATPYRRYATRPRGLAVARGEILTILNSDDAYLPQRLEIMVKAMRAQGALLGFSGVLVIDDNGEAVSAMHPFVNALQP